MTAELPGGIPHLLGNLQVWCGDGPGRSRPLDEIDQQVISALTGSQADAGLAAHVAAGAREPCHG